MAISFAQNILLQIGTDHSFGVLHTASLILKEVAGVDNLPNVQESLEALAGISDNHWEELFF